MEDESEDLFIHRSAIKNRSHALQEGDKLKFNIATDRKKEKRRAINCIFVDDEDFKNPIEEIITNTDEKQESQSSINDDDDISIISWLKDIGITDMQSISKLNVAFKRKNIKQVSHLINIDEETLDQICVTSELHRKSIIKLSKHVGMLQKQVGNIGERTQFVSIEQQADYNLANQHILLINNYLNVQIDKDRREFDDNFEKKIQYFNTLFNQRITDLLLSIKTSFNQEIQKETTFYKNILANLEQCKMDIQSCPNDKDSKYPEIERSLYQAIKYPQYHYDNRFEIEMDKIVGDLSLFVDATRGINITKKIDEIIENLESNSVVGKKIAPEFVKNIRHLSCLLNNKARYHSSIVVCMHPLAMTESTNKKKNQMLFLLWRKYFVTRLRRIVLLL